MLLFIHDYRRKHPEKRIGLTCEMCSVENQQLVRKIEASDFIISKNIGALMMAQISETRKLLDVFEVLLSNDGFEVYIKYAKYYVETDGKYDFFTLSDAVAKRKEIFIGYVSEDSGELDAVINPIKYSNGEKTMIDVNEKTKFIVLAEDRIVRS